MYEIEVFPPYIPILLLQVLVDRYKILIMSYRIVGGPPGFEVFPALYTNTTPDFSDIPDMKGLATHGLRDAKKT